MSATLTRRTFLGYSFGAGALMLGVTDSLAASVFQVGAKPGGKPWQPGVYLVLDNDGAVSIIAHRSEMGTGVRTSLPMVLAEELNADWSRVRILQAIGDTKYGSQNTDGSCSVKDFYDAMRIAGASARTMLEQAAAARWKVPVESVAARNHAVVHGASKRTLPYAELVEAASALPVPDPKSLRFKPAAEYTLVGKTVAITDLDDLVSGKGTFGIDARMPGMVYAAVARPPVLGSRATQVDDAAARKVGGVQNVVRLAEAEPPYVFKALGGAAVIADNSWAALQGRKALNVTWSDSPHASFDSKTFRQQLLTTVQSPQKPLRNIGDVDKALASAAKTHEASVLHRDAGARADGTAGGGRGVPRRQGRDVGGDAEPSGRAGSRGRCAWHRQDRCHVPRHASRRRLRPQIEAGLRRRSGAAFKAGRQAGEDRLEPRRRPAVRLLPRPFGAALQGRHRQRRPADRQS